MKGAIQTGLFSANETVLDLVPDCPNNCTFQTYSSLAICTSFADISSKITRRIVSTDDNYVLYQVTPNHLLQTDGNNAGMINVSSVASLPLPQQSDEMDGALTFNDSIAFPDVKAPITDFILITWNSTTPGQQPSHYGLQAYEVLLEWCIQDYTTDVVNGSATTNRTSASRGFDYGSSSVGLGEYSIDNNAHSSLQRYFQSLFNTSAYQNGLLQPVATSDAAQALYEPFDVAMGTPNAQGVYDFQHGLAGTNLTGLELIMNNTATAMTN